MNKTGFVAFVLIRYKPYSSLCKIFAVSFSLLLSNTFFTDPTFLESEVRVFILAEVCVVFEWIIGDYVAYFYFKSLQSSDVSNSSDTIILV